MRRTLSAALAALGLTGALHAPALAAGMDAFQPQTTYPNFSDVPSGAWYAADVRRTAELGLMQGKGDGRFDPQGQLTLAEAVTMAVQVSARYRGDTFVPGGSPWYQNAVDYAVEHGMLARREYAGYTAPATRADMAGLFAYALPPTELARINRVRIIPDVDAETPYFNEIYALYGAGVLAGTDSGAFQPGAPIDRASAAAILNRLALPRQRVTWKGTAEPAGTAVTHPQKVYSLTLPAEWTYRWTGDILTCQSGSLSITISGPQPGSGGVDAYTASALQADRGAQGVELIDQPAFVWFRGIPAGYYRTAQAGTQTGVYCLPYHSAFLQARLSFPAAEQETALPALWDVLETFDLAL
ncbi:S-layer homology domain-containing protein [Pseudoflavonifractor sp. 524-17]|uniref:S-layer homology domain-containing protein n=1 Tax=Pseudoflavonifractor sp. 524-17 TaxID=2304577 RepID=UPI0013799A5E|nr:S-layer homology domain-containing protein [Pseudoflavonifractor sp. 524-17]NCE63939.1 S-layer homology domain-containing protein [Pseudoflavonifractor sp. 524-17]